MVKNQKALKGKTKKEQNEFEKKGKVEKGFEAALRLMKTTVPKFFHYQESLDHSRALDKRGKWESEKKMMEKFGEEEFYRHLDSGRIQWREGPWTAGIYNYYDRGDISKTTSMRSNKQWVQGQEYQPDNDDQANFAALSGMDLHSLMENMGKGKGHGSLSLVKGKGKGKKGKGRGAGPLAIEDGEVEEKSEEQQWKELLSKAKRARDQAAVVRDDVEAALKKADLAKRLTKQAKGDTESMLEGLMKKANVVKIILAKKEKAMTLSKAKQALVDVMNKTKELKEEAKELNQLANKASSKASKR